MRCETVLLIHCHAVIGVWLYRSQHGETMTRPKALSQVLSRLRSKPPSMHSRLVRAGEATKVGLISLPFFESKSAPLDQLRRFSVQSRDVPLAKAFPYVGEPSREDLMVYDEPSYASGSTAVRHMYAHPSKSELYDVQHPPEARLTGPDEQELHQLAIFASPYERPRIRFTRETQTTFEQVPERSQRQRLSSRSEDRFTPTWRYPKGYLPRSE